MDSKIFALFTLHCLLFASSDGDSSPRNTQEASILLVGMAGSGIFSTTQKLVNSEITKSNTTIPIVTEYSWKVSLGRSGQNTEAVIKIASCPGLVQGKTSEHDTRALETIKEYIQSPSGLNKNYPSIVIVVSRFDDLRARGSKSDFVRMLQNVELLSDDLNPPSLPSNIIFHFTHLMKRNRSEVRRPNSTVDHFKSIIRQYTTFPEPIRVTIGENLSDEYGLPRVGAYVQLPNKQLYPKNIIDEMKTILHARGDNSARNVIEATFRDQFNSPQPTVKTFSVDENSNESEFGVGSDSDINRALKTAYDELEDDLKYSHPTILQMVQWVFQRLNITSKAQLPKSTVKIVELFQKLPFHMAALALVQTAFDLRQPQFTYPPIVGQGYDVVKDKTIPISPFVMNNLQPSPIGYSLPDILICRLEEKNLSENFKLVQSYDEYKETRLKDLGVQENISSSAFVNTIRSSYNNINPESDEFVLLTAVQEIRNFKLDLIESSELDEDFENQVNNLTAFNPKDRESPKEWNAFFNKYGTHVVSEAYGGGMMEGRASGEAIENNLENNNILFGIKDNLLSFKSLPYGVSSENTEIFHSFSGGSPDARLGEAHKLPSKIRENLLKQWKDSVRLNPRISDLNLKLISIDKIVSLVNETIGREVEKSLHHYYNGTLTYLRPKSTTFGTKSSSKNISTTTTESNPFYYYPRKTPSTTTTTLSPNLQCEPFICPDVSTCLECPTDPPPPICPQCPSCPPIQIENNTKFILGHGYHILKDAVLRTTPYSFCMEYQSGILVPVGFKVTNLSNPCVHLTYKRMESYEDYVAFRINKLNITRQPFTKDDAKKIKFSRVMKPGYSIVTDENDQDVFRIYDEMRYLKVEAREPHLSISSEFVDAVKKLQSYQRNRENCTVLKQWFDFFDTYGTHVITGAFAGIFRDIIISGPSVQEIRDMISKGYSSDECRALKDHEKISGIKYQVAVESVNLKKLKNVVSGFQNYLTSDYDTAVDDLVLGKLKYCTLSFMH